MTTTNPSEEKCGVCNLYKVESALTGGVVPLCQCHSQPEGRPVQFIDVPMGVSQWREHGIKYGYDKHFSIVWPK